MAEEIFLDGDTVTAGHTLEQDVDGPFPGLNRPDAIAVRRETIARVTFGLLTQALDFDPEFLVEDELEPAGQDGGPLSLLPTETPQIELLGGPLVVSVQARSQEARMADRGTPRSN